MEAFVFKSTEILTIVLKNREFRFININIGAIWKIPSRKELGIWIWRREADTRDDPIGLSFSVICDFITDSTKQMSAQRKINYVVNILVLFHNLSINIVNI